MSVNILGMVLLVVCILMGTPVPIIELGTEWALDKLVE